MNWDVFSGLATAIACLVAIGIAMRTEYTLKHDAQKRSGLVAATCIPQLVEIAENASRIHTFLTFRKMHIVKGEQFPLLLPRRWEEAIKVLNGDTLTFLEPLQNNAAYRAAEAVGMLREIGHDVREFENGSAGWHQMHVNVREKHIQRITTVFSDAHVILRAALIDFNHAARSKIKPLTPEEQRFVDSV